MPPRRVHVEHTLKRYGIAAEDIHAFLDEPVKISGSKHREFRHDTETVKLVGQMFKGKYSRQMAENIALDHIMLDHQAEIKGLRDTLDLEPEVTKVGTVQETLDTTPSTPSQVVHELAVETRKLLPKREPTASEILAAFRRGPTKPREELSLEQLKETRDLLEQIRDNKEAS